MTDEIRRLLVLIRQHSHADWLIGQYVDELEALLAPPAAPPPADPPPDVLQAVLDAISGTLDPHSQIADHPNVKFAQMQRLKLLQGHPPTEAQKDVLHRVDCNRPVPSEDDTPDD